jgi:malate synthase
VDLARAILKEELARIRAAVGDAQYAAGQFDRASKLFDEIMTSEEFVQFLTLPAYQYLD